MWKSGEAEVEIIGKLSIRQLWWLRQAIPDSLKVGGKSCGKVRKRRRSDVITDNKQQKCPLTRAANISSIMHKTWVEKSYVSCALPKRPKFTSNTVFNKPMFAP